MSESDTSSEEELDPLERRRIYGVKLKAKRGAAAPEQPRRSKRARSSTYKVVHSFEMQKTLAEAQNRAMGDMFSIQPSNIAEGQDGLFAAERIPKNFEIMYFGRYYESGAAVDAAQLEDDRYVFNKANHHFDGMEIPKQLAIYVNHKRRDFNCIFTWSEDYGELGQPSLMTTRVIQPGEELSVDYGPYYDYEKNKFQRGNGATRYPSGWMLPGDTKDTFRMPI
eukprot:COSAG05_NODE_3583_length_1979_cov_6.405851_2_plen_223_part_00